MVQSLMAKPMWWVVFYMLIKLLYMVYVIGMMSLMFTGQKNKFSIEKEVGREINKHWFKCPYSEISYGGEHSSMKIITKEEYQEIEKTFNEYKTKGELLNL